MFGGVTVSDAKCNIRVIIDESAIKNVFSAPFDDDLSLFANSTFFKLMFDYVPMDTGLLAETVDISTDGVKFTVPYAARMYYGDGFNFRTDMHPLAKSHWDTAAMSARKDKLAKSIEDYIRKRGKR